MWAGAAWFGLWTLCVTSNIVSLGFFHLEHSSHYYPCLLLHGIGWGLIGLNSSAALRAVLECCSLLTLLTAV